MESKRLALRNASMSVLSLGQVALRSLTDSTLHLMEQGSPYGLEIEATGRDWLEVSS
jgi:hypothetical protein